MPAWMDYLRYDGVEVVDAARTRAYAEHLGLTFFTGLQHCPDLPQALEGSGWAQRRVAPGVAPTAPWWDERSPVSGRFAGVHLLDVSNLDSSTWTSSVVQGLTDGGALSKGRHEVREMVFRALLIGADEAAVMYGLSWLSTVLRRGNPCLTDTAMGRRRHSYADLLPGPGRQWWAYYKDEASLQADDDLYQGPLLDGLPQTYLGVRQALRARLPITSLSMPLDPCGDPLLEFFVACPEPDAPVTYYRSMLDVGCIQGPQVLSSHQVGGSACTGGAWLEVEFTLAAANPFRWSAPLPIAERFRDWTYRDFLPDVDKEWWQVYKDTADLLDDNDLYSAPLLHPGVQHSYWGLIRVLWLRLPVSGGVPVGAREGAPRLLEEPLWLDPACDPPPLFPQTPGDELLCRPPHEGPWQRRLYTAADRPPLFVESALVVELVADGADFSDVRVRFTPQGRDPDVDSAVQFIAHHIPDGATLRIDGARRSILMYSGEVGTPELVSGPAGHLVSVDAASAAYTFPTLVCGGSWLVSVDTREQDQHDLLGLRVQAVSREG